MALCHEIALRLRCEKCQCRLIAVDSTRYGKWFECIRHWNTPDLCPGTDENRSPLEIEEFDRIKGVQ